MAKVLIIDDENSIRLSFSSILKKHGNDVDAAMNWEEAKELISKKDYDVVFLDILMPKIDGLKILQEIKKIVSDTLVIIMTGEPSIESSQKALRYGATDYLTKPINRDTLFQICDHAIDRTNLLEEKRKLEVNNKLFQDRIEALLEKITELKKVNKTIDVSDQYLIMAKNLVKHQKVIADKLKIVRNELSATVDKIRSASEGVDV